jgi:hypothetical protein
MPEENVAKPKKQRAPKSQQKKPVVREEHKRKSRKELLEDNYKITTPLGRFALVNDADGLTPTEKLVLFVLAIVCGGPGVDYDPELCYTTNKKVAGGSAQSVTVVKGVWASLGKGTDKGPEGKHLIERREEPGRTYTRVLWQKFFPMSYRWRAMLAKEAEEAGSPSTNQVIAADAGETDAAIPTPSAKLSKADEVDEGLSHLDAPPEPPMPQAEPAPEISYRLLKRLLPMVGFATTYGAAYESGFDDAHHAVIPQYCAQFDLEATRIGETWRIALPIEEYTALRLGHHTRKPVAAANCKYIGSKQATDIYSVIEHGLATESWRSSIRGANAPIGLLMAQFDNIRESWIAEGSPTIEPPIHEIIDAILGVDPLWKPPEKVEFTLEERRNNFVAWKAEHANDENVMPEEQVPEIGDAGYEEFWDAETAAQKIGWRDLDPEITGIAPEQTIRWQQHDEEAYLYDSELRRRWEPKQAMPIEEDDTTAEEGNDAMRDDVLAEMRN